MHDVAQRDRLVALVQPLQQTERVCAMIKQLADTQEEPAAESGRKAG